MSTLVNVAPDGDRKVSPHVRLTSDVSLNNIQNEVSVKYALDPDKQWYVMRATYHREKKPTTLSLTSLRLMLIVFFRCGEG